MEDLESIMRGHAEIMKTGLRHGEEIALSKLTTRINQILDAQGLTGEYNQGFRAALVMVRGYVLAEMKGK